jgi:glycosyltransferase involved in cell wall biosynthesis
MSENIHILIPTFNRANLIKETIDSVINQSYKFWVLTIVDNNSTDNTVQMIKKKYKKLIIQKKIIIKTHDIFVAQGDNWTRCIKYIGKYKYFKLLGSDDLLDKNFLLTAINSLKGTNDTIAGFTSGIRYIDELNNQIGQRTYGFFGFELLISTFYRNYFGAPSSQVLKSKFFRNSKFPPVPYAGDVLYIYTYCYAKKRKLIFNKNLLADFRLWPEGDSSKCQISDGVKNQMIEGRYICRDKIIKTMFKKSHFLFVFLFISKVIRIVEYIHFFCLDKLKACLKF